MFAPYFKDYVNAIIAQYKKFRPIDLTTSIGFTGTVNERFTVFTPQVDSDCLIFGANVDFNNALVTIRITDTATGYVWNPTVYTPIVAVAGIQTQVTPVLPLICPFFLSRQSKLQMDFVNSASSATTGGNITWVGVKLEN
ncbi:MAG: hypothetical protein KGJ13_05665 [Patescibacteria group bacterium]|nr:hypothetical protein [Patescibacteria group bacterium]